MWNKILLSSVLLASATSMTYAGDMGPVESYPFKPFILGEAAYSWPQTGGINVATSFGSVISDTTVQGWGGRLATGLMRQISERFALSFEGGLMYNDHIAMSPLVKSQGVTVRLPFDAIRGNFDQYGLDLLAGINFVRPKYDLFFKAGALFENMRTSIDVDTNALMTANIRRDHFVRSAYQSINANVGQVMPEIKLGGAYHFSESWSLTAAWMHAFGGTLEFTSDELNFSSGNFTIGNTNFSLNNPTIDSVLFGIQYDFN